MLLGNKLKIESDEVCVTIYEKYISKKTGDEMWKPVSYHPNVRMALKYLVDREVNGTGLKDLEEVTNKIEELYKWIEEVI